MSVQDNTVNLFAWHPQGPIKNLLFKIYSFMSKIKKAHLSLLIPMQE